MKNLHNNRRQKESHTGFFDRVDLRCDWQSYLNYYLIHTRNSSIHKKVTSVTGKNRL